MALFLAVLAFAAKALLALFLGVVALGIALLVLPMKAHVAGRLKIDGDFEEFLEGEGAIGAGGVPCEDTPVTLTAAGEANVRVLGGALGVDYAEETGLKLVVLGVRFSAPAGIRSETQTKSEDESSRPSQESGQRETRRQNRRFLGRVLTLGNKGAADKRTRPGSHRSVRFADIKMWLSPTVRKRFLATAKSIFRSLHFRGSVHSELGLPDPSIAGMAYAAFVTWSGATQERWLTFRPDFVNDVVSVEVNGSTRLVGAQIAWIMGRFFLSRDIRPLWQKKRAGESKKAPVLGAHTTG